VATDPALLKPDSNDQRNSTNFFSSAGGGLLPIERGEAVYVLPPEVLARFAGKDKLYFAAAAHNGEATPELSQFASGSAYISLKNFTGRSLRRIQLLPSRQRAAFAKYAGHSGNELTWGGDVSAPGTQPVSSSHAPAAAPQPSNGASKSSSTTAKAAAPASAPTAQAASADYNDGYGYLPPPTAVDQHKKRTLVAAKALEGQCYTLNWDDVQLIPQPSNFSCWGAAGAMVVGWRDQVSLTPDTIARICHRTTATGLDPAQVQTFATDLTLAYENPQCFTIEGFHSLLESYGPLWVGAAVPSLHAIVVTGMRSDGAPDGSDTYVRIADPWDRVIATPGSPGAYLRTHNTGSRYILTWDAFVREYEAAPMSYPSVNLQIMHSQSTAGRQPNRSGAQGYAQAAAATNNNPLRKIEPGAAHALDDDIPLDPGAGGLCIDTSALEIGDIILSTTDAASSGFIRFGTGSQVSHAMLFVGQGGQVIEAMGSGVRMMPLADAIAHATLAVAFRSPSLTDDQKGQIADAAAGFIGLPYNKVGIVRQVAFQIHSRVCSLLPDDAQERCRNFVGQFDLGTSNNSQFFCSEMVLAAFQAAGCPLTTTPPVWSSPEDLAQLFFRRGALAYVGHLKAPPLTQSRSLRDVLGLSLAATDTTSTALLQQAQRLGVGDIVQKLIGEGANPAEIQQLLNAFDSRPSAPVQASALTVSQPIPVKALPAHLPPARAATTAESIAINAALALIPPPLGPMIAAARTLSSTRNVSVGIGPSAGVGFTLGMGAGAGVILAPGGQIGIYGHLDVRAGILDSAAAGFQMTIVRGGIEAFNEVAFVGGGAFVEGVDATVEVLFAADMSFRGVSFELGAGLSVEPFEIFVGIEGSLSGQMAGPPPAQTATGASLAYAAAAAIAPASRGKGNGAAARPSPPPPRRGPTAMATQAVEIATTIAGAVIEKVISNEGSIRWELEQLRGIKNPNNTAPAQPAPFHDASPIVLNQWPYLDALDGDRLSAWFQVDWQYNGTSLGNVRIRNIGTNGALLRGLNVEAKIMDDDIVYPADNGPYAALRVNFIYRFTRAIGSDAIAHTELHLFGDGNYEASSAWDQ
jgi:uncharacterized protein YycO